MKSVTTYILTFLFLTINNTQAASNGCFAEISEYNLVHNRLKTQVICSNTQSLKVCHDLVLSKGFSDKTEKELPVPSCDKSSIKFASTLPIATSVIKTLNTLDENLTKNLSRRLFVNSVVDFHHHTIMHKKRVTELALNLAAKFPNEFKGISTKMIIGILSNHDNAKIDPKYRYGKTGPFYETLYKYYGTKPPLDIINQLNKIDGEIMETALRKQGLGLDYNDSKIQRMNKISLRNKIFKLEKLADFVDRAMNEVSPEEFGRKMWKESSVAKNPVIKKMAIYLEGNYEKIVAHLKYKKLSPKQYFVLAQKIKIDKYFKTILNSGRTIKEVSQRALSGLAKIISTRVESKMAITGARIAMGASIAVDGLLLLGFSPSVACSSMPGYHDWKVQAGKCKPVSGLTEKFISYLTLPKQTQKDELEHGQNMCKVLRENNNMNKGNIFTQISCSPGGARMEIETGKYMDIQYDLDGNISKILLTSLKPYVGGILGRSYNELTYNKSGKLEKLCKPTNIGITTCRTPNSESAVNNTNNITNFIGSMNYKIQQGIGCCLGVKNDFNKNIRCKV